MNARGATIPPEEQRFTRLLVTVVLGSAVVALELSRAKRPNFSCPSATCWKLAFTCSPVGRHVLTRCHDLVAGWLQGVGPGDDPKGMIHSHTEGRSAQSWRSDWTRVILVIGAVSAVFFALAFAASPPPANQAGAHPKSSAALTVFVAPASINATCGKDVTWALGKWLLSVPNGKPGNDNVAELPAGACYLVNGSIWWRGARDIVLDGNGATLRQTSTVPGVVVGGLDNLAVVPYCGKPTAYRNSNYSGPRGIVLMLSFEGGCNITVENLRFTGTHVTYGMTDRGATPDSFLTFYGTQRALVTHVMMTGPWGDYVDVTGLSEAGFNGASYPGTDVTVEDSWFSDAGREGIAEVNAHRVLITDNRFTGSARMLTATLFDIEQDVIYVYPNETDINITGNEIEGASYCFLVSAQTGSVLQRIAFTDNVLSHGAQMKIYITPHEYGRVHPSIDILVAGNTASAVPIGWNRSSVVIKVSFRRPCWSWTTLPPSTSRTHLPRSWGVTRAGTQHRPTSHSTGPVRQLSPTPSCLRSRQRRRNNQTTKAQRVIRRRGLPAEISRQAVPLSVTYPKSHRLV